MTILIGCSRPALLAFALAICPLAPGWAATVYDIDITRTSADGEAPTFSGTGVLTLEAPSRISALSLTVETLGTLDGAEVAYTFDYTLDDVAASAGVAPLGPGLAGAVSFVGLAAADGNVVLDALRLDFAGGSASGFCFSAAEASECVRGGGTSTGIDADLSAVVPLPASGLAILAGLGALVGLRRRG